MDETSGNTEVVTEKKYIVRLNQSGRKELKRVIAPLIGTSQKVRRAQILLKADRDGSAWTISELSRRSIAAPKP